MTNVTKKEKEEILCTFRKWAKFTSWTIAQDKDYSGFVKWNFPVLLDEIDRLNRLLNQDNKTVGKKRSQAVMGEV